MKMNLKQKIQNLFFPLGSIQTIRVGFLKNYKIRLTENSSWSPLLGRWEPAIQKIMANVIEPGQIVYDLGANNGLHGLLMAGLVGEKGLVYNFEPLPENIEELEENFKLNNITNFRNIAAAVSGKDGMETFVLQGHQKQAFLSGGEQSTGRKAEVKTMTLDSFIKEGNPGPAFIKIDIEGAEGPALKGFSGMIGKFAPLMVIELHNPAQDREVGAFLKDHQYTAYRFDPFARLEFTEVTDHTQSYPHTEGIWGTIFCLPPGKALNDYHFDK